ncbi:MAG: N-acetyltransferase [Schwartzia sp.]|nr:N-acetyltransferase [Schwartzia sp. (in: firmicutes)]
MTIVITREEQTDGGRYTAVADGRPAGMMTYRRPEKGRIVIDHTRVESTFNGQGVGARLVARAIDDARTGGYRITPVCSFAVRYFGKHPETADVLAGENPG